MFGLSCPVTQHRPEQHQPHPRQGHGWQGGGIAPHQKEGEPLEEMTHLFLLLLTRRCFDAEKRKPKVAPGLCCSGFTQGDTKVGIDMVRWRAVLAWMKGEWAFLLFQCNGAKEQKVLSKIFYLLKNGWKTFTVVEQILTFYIATVANASLAGV